MPVRDLVLLGVGAGLAVAALALPLDLFGRLAAGLTVAGAFLVLSAVRVGRDLLAPEEWLLRRLRFRPTRYAYYAEEAPAPAKPQPEPQPGPLAPPKAAAPPKPAAAAPPAAEPAVVLEPVVGRAVFLGLVAVALVFVRWLAAGGGEEVARSLAVLLRWGR